MSFVWLLYTTKAQHVRGIAKCDHPILSTQQNVLGSRIQKLTLPKRSDFIFKLKI